MKMVYFKVMSPTIFGNYTHKKENEKREFETLRLKLPLKVGGLLLSHFRSTIGAGGLNFSVRNGKRWNPAAITALILQHRISAFNTGHDPFLSFPHNG